MKMKDVPVFPAYVVFHDAHMNGAMDVWPANSLEEAEARAARAQNEIEATGEEECGFYRAYAKLPRKQVFKFYSPKH